MMSLTLVYLMLTSLAAAPAGANAIENPVFNQLRTEGIKMSDGTAVKLPPPIMADGLDAAGARAALNKVADARHPLKELVAKSYYAPVVTKVRTVKEAEGEGPAVRTIDAWFVVHGDWDTLVSKDFLESMTGEEQGKSRVVLKSGVLTDKEMQKRNLIAASTKQREERFLYTTFWLFERVQVSATRFSVLTRGKDSVLAAGQVDVRFDKDAEYPNQWRPLLRDAEANIKPGRPHPFARAGGYAKITRLKEPAAAMFIEFHLVYEEPYAWFDGINLVKQKVPVMVQEKIRTFRRKLTAATEEKGQKK
jgi:hypothetical protein